VIRKELILQKQTLKFLLTSIIIPGLFLLSCLSAITHGPVPSEKKDLSTQEQEFINDFLNSDEPGILTALNGEKEMNGTQDGFSFNLPGKEFKGDLLVINKSKEALDWQILCLVDSQPTSFDFNDNVADQQFLKMKPQEKRRMKIALGGLSKGAHDLIFLALDRKVSMPGYLCFFHRVELFAGSKKHPKQDFTVADNRQCLPDEPDFIVVGKDKTLNLENVGSPIKFNRPQSTLYLFANNTEDKPLNLTLVPLLNGRRIVSQNADHSGTMVWRVHPKSLAVIPIIVDTRSFNPEDDFMILCIENPNIHLETQPGELITDKIEVQIPYRDKVDI
jgi:hypothetical protein